jgi:hypothetical protein
MISVVLVVIAMIVLSVLYINFMSPMSFKQQVQNYDGDGTIEDISFRFAVFLPIDGYIVSFDKINLEDPYTKTYTLTHLPEEREVSVYLTVEDPDDSILFHIEDEDPPILDGSVSISVTDESGKEFINFTEPLHEMRWSTAFRIRGHSLYPDSSLNSFLPDREKTYQLTIKYSGDAYLKGYKGFISMRSGGSI